MSENDTNKEPEGELEKTIQEQIKAMAKAIIVSMAWSGTELLDKKPAKDNLKTDSEKEKDDNRSG